mgnify:CR=1 FL=1
MLMAAIKQKEIDTRTEINETDILSIIEKQVQQRFEAAELYEQAERNELFDKEMAEAEILKTYLPEKLSEEEVRLIISTIINGTGANTLKDMGNFEEAIDSYKQALRIKPDFSDAYNNFTLFPHIFIISI